MKPYFWALLCSLTWGCVPLLEKFGLLKIDPLVGLFYRCLGVVIGLALLLLFKFDAIKASFSESMPGMPYLIIGGFLASVVGQIFFYHGLKTGEASKIVPLAGTYPLVTFILGVILLGEKFTWAKAGGMTLVVLGVILLK